MPRKARYDVLDPGEVQCVHAVTRCVRRAFLCGVDPVSGQSFEHRKDWIRDRMAFLAAAFGIDVLTYTAMSNHLHVVLRSRPDVVAAWSDQEVARRWLMIFPKRRDEDRSPAKPTDADLRSITADAPVLAERRRRLSDVSWFMRCTSENLARRANAEDGCTGRFFEGRFKAQVLLDEASLIACAAYVDLNPIRAAMADTPEASEHTGAKERIDDLSAAADDRSRDSWHDWERSQGRDRSGWLSPVQIDESSDRAGSDVSPSGRRASDKGFLPISVTAYLELLDWTGRQLRSDKVGSIPGHLSPILRRIGVDARGWCDVVTKFGRIFKRAAGTPESLAGEAIRRGQGWLCAPENPLGLSGG